MLGIIRSCACAAMLLALVWNDVEAASRVVTAGGSVQLTWNDSLLSLLHIEKSPAIESPNLTTAASDQLQLSSASTLVASVSGQSVQRIEVASLAVEGGYRLTTATRIVSLESFVLRKRPGMETIFDLVTQYGEVPFYVNNMLVEPTVDGKSIRVRSMDVRISPWLANLLGKPEVIGWPVASMRVTASIATGSPSPLRESCPVSLRWPGMRVLDHPGERYHTDVFMQSLVVEMTGCEHCSGPAGQGRLKVTPTTILRNNVNDGKPEETVSDDPRGISNDLFAADVPWRNMFSQNCAPYNNDQHPYLTWSLYRINAAGQLEQVGRAGVKHAHTAQNSECVSNQNSNHVLGRGCADVYGTGDNDAQDALGPRSEIIPFTGQWGRCASIFDPKCTGKQVIFTAGDPWQYRLGVPESLLAHLTRSGDRFVFEAWYVVRDDVNPYNSMAHVPVEFSWYATNGLWAVHQTQRPVLGAVIDEWVDADHADNLSDSQELATPSGRIKAAVRASRLQSGNYRYDFAVMNVDFAIVKTSGREPDLRLLSNHGIDSVSITTSSSDKVTAITFADADQDSSNDWRATEDHQKIIWRGSARNELTWGSLFRFSFESNQPPKPTKVRLDASTGNSELELTLFRRSDVTRREGS